MGDTFGAAHEVAINVAGDAQQLTTTGELLDGTRAEIDAMLATDGTP